MAGAIFIVDQIPGAGAGTAGVPREDLHADKDLQLRAAFPSGVVTYEWSILDSPPGSTGLLDDASDPMPTISAVGTPGTLQLQLITNGGGPGNVTVQSLGIKSDATGVVVPKRGWRYPAYGETNETDDFAGSNERGWAEAVEVILHDLEDNAFIVNDSMTFALPGAVQAAPMTIGKTRPLVAQMRFDPSVWRHSSSNVQLRLDVRLFHPTSDHTSDVKLFKKTSPAVQLGATQTVTGLGEKAISLDFSDIVASGFVAGDMIYELRVATSFQTSDPGDLGSNAGAYEVPVLLSRLLFRNKV